jgi:hypothetical protein
METRGNFLLAQHHGKEFSFQKMHRLLSFREASTTQVETCVGAALLA